MRGVPSLMYPFSAQDVEVHERIDSFIDQQLGRISIQFF